MKWACGITTVPERRNIILPATLTSLIAGGFSDFRLFVDGPEEDGPTWEHEFGMPATMRGTKLGAWNNWILGLHELYIRNPNADRYAMFQDDLICYRNLRPYLERHDLKVGYLNLYTAPQNGDMGNKGTARGWHRSPQNGKGALALVFNREGVEILLSHPYLTKRPTEGPQSQVNIDGAIVSTFKYDPALEAAGWAEHVHTPTLVQHTGTVSTLECNDGSGNPHRCGTTYGFLGDAFDCDYWGREDQRAKTSNV